MTIQDIDVWGSHGTAVKEISVSDMAERGKLLTLDHVRNVLASTEPISSIGFPVADRIDFRLEKGWNWDHRERSGDDMVDAFVRVGNQEYQMSQDAILEAASLCGLSKAYVLKTPAGLIEPHLKFWYKGGFDETKEYKALIVGEENHCKAVTRATINPFSNLRLLEESLNAIEAKYGEGEVFADYKFEHSLRRTHLRLIVPAYMRTIEHDNAEDDNWSLGIQFLNSLIGESQTSFDGYMFRWLCTNGAIDTFANSSKWSRKSGGQGEEIYEWARAAVDEVFEGLEHSLDLVQATTEISIDGEVNDVLKEVFDTYAIPGAARQLVVNNMVETDDLSMYGVMQAITAAANSADVDPNHVLGLMQAGGSLPHIANQRCGSCKRFTAHSH